MYDAVRTYSCIIIFIGLGSHVWIVLINAHVTDVTHCHNCWSGCRKTSWWLLTLPVVQPGECGTSIYGVLLLKPYFPV